VDVLLLMKGLGFVFDLYVPNRIEPEETFGLNSSCVKPAGSAPIHAHLRSRLIFMLCKVETTFIFPSGGRAFDKME
jgi:hypothetical protein